MDKQNINYRLPDIPDIPSGDMAGEIGAAWSSEDMRRWRLSSGLADWTDTFFMDFEKHFGEQFPQLLFQGLGGASDVPLWLRRGSPEPKWLHRFLLHSDSAQTWFETGFLSDDPAWLSRLLLQEEAMMSRSFILSGNINDYMFDPAMGYRHIIRLLIDRLMAKKDCVLTYSLSKGLRVYSRHPDIREKLPERILLELEADGIHPEIPLLTEICRLFDVMNHWLSGENGSTEPDSREFIQGVAVVFENIHLLIPQHSGDIERHYLIDNILRWSNSPELFRSPHCLILTAESIEDISGELRMRGGKIEQITVPWPDRSRDRLKFLLALLDPESGMKETRISLLPSGLAGFEGYSGTDVEKIRGLSHDTAGLNLIGIEDLIQEALAAPGKKLNRDAVMGLKGKRLRRESEGILELIDPKTTFDDIGGYPMLKERLREVVQAMRHSEDDLIRSTLPMGILLLGPPGTGKSIIAEALAGESGINMCRLGNFRGMYVGQSERNLNRVFGLIEALHPVIVFIDEIDQALGKRSMESADGGLDNRIFGRFLEFMSNTRHRGRILWIGASNFPEKIDPAMKRAGRFDLILPVLLPDATSRKSIIVTLLKRMLPENGRMKNALSDMDYDHFAEATKGFSGAELRALVGEIMRRAVRFLIPSGGKVVLDRQLFDEVLESYHPPAGQREKYREMERRAIEDVSFIDLLPVSFQEERKKRK